MNGAASAVAPKLAHLQGFVDDTLTRERSVTVHENGQYRETFGVAEGVKLGTTDTFENRIDCLEVAGIGGDRCLDGVTRGCGELAFITEVVLNVTGPLRIHRLGIAFEFTEDLSVGFPDDVG